MKFLMRGFTFVLTGCAMAPLTSMDMENEKGGRISKLNYTHHEQEADQEIIVKMKAKCPSGYKIKHARGKDPLGRRQKSSRNPLGSLYRRLCFGYFLAENPLV